MIIFYALIIGLFSFILYKNIKVYKNSKSKLDLMGVIGVIIIILGAIAFITINLLKWSI